MYKISDIARLFHISTKTLHFYEEKGLLIPIRDENNRYRYYDERSIGQLAIILHLKHANMPISNIQDCIHEQTSAKKTLAFLQAEKEKLEKLIHVVDVMSSESGYEIRYGHQDFAYVYQRAKLIHDIEEIPDEFSALIEEIMRQGHSIIYPYYYYAEYTDETFSMQNIHANLFFEIENGDKGQVRPETNMSIRPMEAYDYIYVLHTGAYDQVGNAYQFLENYVEQHSDIEVYGSPIECYCIYGKNNFFHTKQVTEIRFKIRKR